MFLARESRRRKIERHESLRNRATSHILRMGLRMRVDRLDQNQSMRSFPVHVIMCAVTVQRAWNCYKKRLARKSSMKIQARWREHLWCIETIRRSLKRIELRVQRGAFNEWSETYLKRKRARAFLKKHLMGQQQRLLIQWHVTVCANSEERERKRVAGTAKFLKRQLHKTFHALEEHRDKCHKVKAILRKRIAGIKGSTFKSWIHFTKQAQNAQRCVETIQGWWNSLQMVVTRKIIIRKRRLHAAIEIQRRWRGCHLRATFASRKIQCRWRIYVAKNRRVATEFRFRRHERLRGISERFVSQKSFQIDGPRIAGEYLGRGEYMASGMSTGFGKKARRVRARKNKVLMAVAAHLQKSFYLKGVSTLSARGGKTYALERSIGLAFDMFDPHLEGKVPVGLIRNVLAQLLGRKHEFATPKSSMKVGHNLDRNATGYIDRDVFMTWYKNTIGVDAGRPRIELALNSNVEAIAALGLAFGAAGDVADIAAMGTTEINEAGQPAEAISGAQAMTPTRRKSWIGRQMANTRKSGGERISLRSRIVGHGQDTSDYDQAKLNKDTMLLPAAEVAFFEAAKWVIRDMETSLYRKSGEAVGDDGEHVRRGDIFTEEDERDAREAFTSEADISKKKQTYAIALRETTTPRWIGSDDLNAMTFGTYAAMREFEKRVLMKEDEAVARLSLEKCMPAAGTTVRAAFDWLQDTAGILQQEVRGELRSMAKAEEARVNTDQLNGESEQDYLRRLRDNRRMGEHSKYGKEAARIAAELRRKKEEEQRLLASLGGPGAHHELKDHRTPVVFKLRSFSKEREYRARWSSVDSRTGRNGKKMPTLRGIQYASKKNASGFSVVRFKLPRVGIYRVDIEMRHAITRGEAWGEVTGIRGGGSSSRGDGGGGDEEGAANCADEASKMVSKLRQVVEKSRWEAIAGSPKFVNARFSVSKYKEEKAELREKERLKVEKRDEKFVASHFGDVDLTRLNMTKRAALKDTEHVRFSLDAHNAMNVGWTDHSRPATPLELQSRVATPLGSQQAADGEASGNAADWGWAE